MLFIFPLRHTTAGPSCSFSTEAIMEEFIVIAAYTIFAVLMLKTAWDVLKD